MYVDDKSKINYVIAQFWDKNHSDSLCCYAYMTETFYGTREEAKSFAKRVSEATSETYKVFVINTSPL